MCDEFRADIGELAEDTTRSIETNIAEYVRPVDETCAWNDLGWAGFHVRSATAMRSHTETP